MKPIAVFYHCAFFRGSPDHPAPRGGEVITGNMNAFKNSGLLDAAQEVTFGINGGQETEVYVACYLPAKGRKVYHGLKAAYENYTILELEKFVKDHPGWNVLYFHSKGITHTDANYIAFLNRWVNCMTRNLITNWRQCVDDLESFDSVGCHWMEKVGVPPEDNIWGGNFWWATSDFLQKVPSITERPLIKQHGMDSPLGRYEVERWIGCSGIKPKTKDYCTYGIGMDP